MKVIIYTNPNCLQSKQLKRYLIERGVVFIEKDVTASEANADEMYETGYDEAPVIKIDTGNRVKALQGFDSDLAEYLDFLLKTKR